MRYPVIQFLCYFVALLQALTSLLPAQGLMLCVPSGGAAHIASRLESMHCGDEHDLVNDSDRSGLAVAAASRDCVDLSVGTGDRTTLKAARHVAGDFDRVPVFAVVPAFLRVTPDPFARTPAPRVVTGAALAPDATLAALGGVILVV